MARTPKTPIPDDVREIVLKRDNYRCRYCGSLDGPFQMDHVYPESKGGITTVENLVTACGVCNNKKHAKVGRWPMPLGYWEEHDKLTLEFEKQERNLQKRFTDDLEKLQHDHQEALSKLENEYNQNQENAINEFAREAKSRASVWGNVLLVAFYIMCISVLFGFTEAFLDIHIIPSEYVKLAFQIGMGIEILSFGMWLGGNIALRRKR